jgi:uncharacterized protein
MTIDKPKRRAIRWLLPAACLCLAATGAVAGEAGGSQTAMTLASIFAGGVVMGLAGFAFSAVSGALLLHWLAPTQAVPLLLACSITIELYLLTRLWRSLQWRSCAPFLCGGLIGIPLGTYLLLSLDARVFGAGFGIFLVCYSAYTLLRPGIVVRRGGRLADMVSGFGGGITGGAMAFPGAFPTIWCNLRGLSKDEQRGVVQPYILLMQIATLAYLATRGSLSLACLYTYLWCAPAALVGASLGLRLFRRIDDVTFRRVVLIVLLGCGATLLGKTFGLA